MLRLGTLDIASGEAPAILSADFITKALGNLVSERQIDGTASVAIEQLCVALISDAPQVALAYVERLLECGVSIEAIYDSFIPRAAARLGQMWAEDLLPFTGVTLAMARLTEVYRSLSPLFMKSRKPLRRGRRALFAVAPGEHHLLGVVMAADHFQRAGWSVQVELQASRRELVGIVKENQFALIGISAGSRRMIPVVRDTVLSLRSVARPDTTFMLGGALATLDESVATDVGIDVVSGTASHAVNEIERG